MRFIYRSITIGSNSSSRVYRTQSTLRVMVARGQWFLRELEAFIGLVSFLYTMIAFLLVVSCLPFLFATYIVVRTVRGVWFRFLKGRFPELEFVKNTSVRSAIDTKRNQGLITVLLQVKGRCDKERLRAQLREHIVERRKADGSLAFPHLRTSLTTRWGRYAWEKPKKFHLDNHLVTGGPLFRGRPITEQNIQECVSDIVTKYLPPEQSPWQVTIIPTLSGPEERFFVLIRLHHLLMSEEGLGLGDLLLLSPDKPSLWRMPLGEDDENPVPETTLDRRLVGHFKTLVAVPKLYSSIRETFISNWNDFILNYDPLENKDILKSPPFFTTSLTVMIIVSIAVLRDLVRSLRKSSDSCFTTLSNVLIMIQRHAEKRRCSLSFLLRGLCHSLHPIHIASTTLIWIWWFGVTTFIRIPILMFREILLFSLKGSITPGTNAEIVYNWWKLLCESLKELWYLWKVIYTGPRILIEEILRSNQGQSHQLQTVSLCGRKVVSWSDPVPVALIHKICTATGSTSSEVLMSASVRALRDYFRQLGLSVPDEVLATARYLPLQELMNPSKIGGGRDGWLCLALPTRTSLGDEDDPQAGLRQLQVAVKGARDRQTLLQLVSQWPHQNSLITSVLPSFIVRLIVNYFSKRYCVTLTDIAPESAHESGKRLLWGQEVESVIYWRPPQANISLSLSLMNYGDTVRLGVMSDAQLSPQHTMLASGFIHQLQQLAMVAGVPRERSTPPSTPVCRTFPPLTKSA
ncbi:uncharacterized protein [Anabrus simplex]|uniref:uncharacterized protein isoform X2 n=1 Tax=Anabrus simplex TaxID=316456 RepID=UPI0035A308C7